METTTQQNEVDTLRKTVQSYAVEVDSLRAELERVKLMTVKIEAERNGAVSIVEHFAKGLGGRT